VFVVFVFVCVCTFRYFNILVVSRFFIRVWVRVCVRKGAKNRMNRQAGGGATATLRAANCFNQRQIRVEWADKEVENNRERQRGSEIDR